MKPPMSATNTISHAQSGGRPSSRMRTATMAPQAAKFSAKKRPKVLTSRPRRSISCSTRARLQVTGRVDRRPVDAHLEVQVRTGGVARVARLADDLALADALAHGHADARLVAVARRQRAGVLDA